MTTKEHLKQHDREIAAIRKLILTGMKMLVRNEAVVKRLGESQEKTEATLRRLIESLGRGASNGHNGGKKAK